jgi:hypothetical protein
MTRKKMQPQRNCRLNIDAASQIVRRYFSNYNIYPADIMDNKYVKIAVILVIASFIIITMVFAVIVLAVRGPALLGK